VKDSFRQSMAWLHTWSGLVLGWVMFVIFYTGTVAFFKQEITLWSQPELVANPIEPVSALAFAQDYLQDKAPDAQTWHIVLPERGYGGVQLSWLSESGAGVVLLNHTGEQVRLRPSRGGEFFYRMHFDLHYLPRPVARWLVGVASILMFIALVTGVIIHRRIFVDFFMLRLGKGQRSWLDGHNVAAVLALPFHLMITYTGLVTFVAILVPNIIHANYTNYSDYREDVYIERIARPATGESSPLLPLPLLAKEARDQWGGRHPGEITVEHPGDSAATVMITGALGQRFSAHRQAIYVDGVTGEPLALSAPTGIGTALKGDLVGLHAGRFAKPGLRWLLFLSGVLGTLMIATGLVLWTAKRRRRQERRLSIGFRLVEKLNIGVLAGLPAGTAAYFLANRLLPLDLPSRAECEIHSLFLAWLLIVGVALLLRGKRAWIVAHTLTAALFLSAPIVNAVTTNRGIVASIATGDAVYLGVDLTLCLTGVVFAAMACIIATHRAAPIRDHAQTTS